jgi:Cu2+-exporting ATPase
MVEDFKRRFWISFMLTIPVLFLSQTIREFIHLELDLSFHGNIYILFALSSIIYFYGGWPFLKGIYLELLNHKPGMMTLVAVAISVAYVYSSFVIFGFPGMVFFCELAMLIDIMLLGHWIEMKSIMGAGEALEKIARLMPAEAHKLMPDDSIKEIPLSELQIGDRVLIKPGEKIPADGTVINGKTNVNESMLTGESKPVAKTVGASSLVVQLMVKDLSL